MTKEQEAALDKLPQASIAKSDEKTKMEEQVQKVRDLGRYLKKNAGRCLAERQLAEKLRRALKAGLQALRHASPKQEEKLMQQVRDLGHYPKESAEGRLAERIRRARKANMFSSEQEAELQALQQELRDARAQGVDAGIGIRRRPAACNAEEDRRLSRRTGAA